MKDELRLIETTTDERAVQLLSAGQRERPNENALHETLRRLDLSRAADEGSVEREAAELPVPAQCPPREPTRRNQWRTPSLWGGIGLSVGVLSTLLVVAISQSTMDLKRGMVSPEPSAREPAVSPPLSPTSTRGCGGNAATLDDLEDADFNLCLQAGRDGFWFTFHDGGQLFPPPGKTGGQFQPSAIPGGRGSSRYAAHAYGFGHQRFAALALAFRRHRSSYDASAYGGVRFWAKGSIAGPLKVAFTTSDTLPPNFGGRCQHRCFDHHHSRVELAEQWQSVEIRFEDLRQSHFGDRVAFEPSRLVGIEFRFPEGGAPFDVWIDDVEFLPRPGH